MLFYSIFTTLWNWSLYALNGMTQIGIYWFLVYPIPIANVFSNKKPFNFPRWCWISQITDAMCSNKSDLLVSKWMRRIHFDQIRSELTTVCKPLIGSHLFFITNYNNCQIRSLLFWNNWRRHANKSLFLDSLFRHSAWVVSNKDFV